MDDPPIFRRFAHDVRSIVGETGVLDDPASLDRHGTDFWGQHRGRTGLVVRPGSTAEVQAIVRLAGRDRIALVPQSGNTGLCGGNLPDASGRQVVLSLDRMRRIRHVAPTGDHLVAEAGCVLAEVQRAAGAAGRYFPLSLGSEGSCRIGGNLSTNAGGVNVLRYGMAREQVLGLEVVLPTGEIWDGLRALRKDNTGFDLKQLFIGAEGALGVITAAVLKLLPAPRERVTVWLGIERPAQAVELLGLFQAELGELVSSFELLAGFGVEAAATHLPGVRRPLALPQPWHLLVEAAWSLRDGLAARVEAVLETAIERGLVRDGTIAGSEAQRATMWRIREGQSEATRGLGFIVRSDVTVPVGAIPLLIERLERWVPAVAPEATLLPFGHVGDGNLHVNFIVPKDAVERLRPLLLERLHDDVTAFAGSISAEHGIGRFKVEELARRKGAVELDLMRRLKVTLDPLGIMNPGVIVAIPTDQPPAAEDEGP